MSGLLATLSPAAAVRRAVFTRLRHGDVAGVSALAVGNDGQMVAVGGLSVVPAGHELLLDGRPFWTWCAFDAIGIPAALGVDAFARTRCGHCDTRLEVTVTDGQPRTDSPVVERAALGAHVWSGMTEATCVDPGGHP